MSTLAEIETAVSQLPSDQQKELYARLAARVDTAQTKGLTPEEFEAWFD